MVAKIQKRIYYYDYPDYFDSVDTDSDHIFYRKIPISSDVKQIKLVSMGFVGYNEFIGEKGEYKYVSNGTFN